MAGFPKLFSHNNKVPSTKLELLFNCLATDAEFMWPSPFCHFTAYKKRYVSNNTGFDRRCFFVTIYYFRFIERLRSALVPCLKIEVNPKFFAVIYSVSSEHFIFLSKYEFWRKNNVNILHDGIWMKKISRQKISIYKFLKFESKYDCNPRHELIWCTELVTTMK